VSSLPVTFSRISRGIVALLDPEVRLEQVPDGEADGRLAAGDGAPLEDEPAVSPIGMEELSKEAGFSHAALAHHRDDLTSFTFTMTTAVRVAGPR